MKPFNKVENLFVKLSPTKSCFSGAISVFTRALAISIQDSVHINIMLKAWCLFPVLKHTQPSFSLRRRATVSLYTNVGCVAL